MRWHAARAPWRWIALAIFFATMLLATCEDRRPSIVNANGAKTFGLEPLIELFGEN